VEQSWRTEALFSKKDDANLLGEPRSGRKDRHADDAAHPKVVVTAVFCVF